MKLAPESLPAKDPKKFEKGNYKELARLIQILSKDREKRVKYGTQARKIVESHNIEKEYVKRQVEIIGNLL